MKVKTSFLIILKESESSPEDNGNSSESEVSNADIGMFTLFLKVRFEFPVFWGHFAALFVF